MADFKFRSFTGQMRFSKILENPEDYIDSTEFLAGTIFYKIADSENRRNIICSIKNAKVKYQSLFAG